MHFKPLILAGCVALGMALPAAAAPGAAAPDFAIADTSGKPVKLSAGGSIDVLTGPPFETSSSILVSPNGASCAPVRLPFLMVAVRYRKRKFNFGMVVVDE